MTWILLFILYSYHFSNSNVLKECIIYNSIATLNTDCLISTPLSSSIQSIPCVFPSQITAITPLPFLFFPCKKILTGIKKKSLTGKFSTGEWQHWKELKLEQIWPFNLRDPCQFYQCLEFNMILHLHYKTHLPIIRARRSSSLQLKINHPKWNNRKIKSIKICESLRSSFVALITA